MLDGYFIATYKPGMLTPWYLMTSYLYHKCDESIISDHLFDWICVELTQNWLLTEHRHKYLIDRGRLIAGTGYYLNFDKFPSIIISAAIKLKQLADIDNAKQ